jgi:O-antigen/teichoic acid export membrane protein
MSIVPGTEKIGETRVSTYEKNVTEVAKGGGITFAGKIFLNVIRFGTAVLLARILGANQLGLYNLSLSAMHITVGLALFGLDAAIIRFIAVNVGRQDEDGVWKVLQIGMGIPLILSALVGTALYALSFVIAEKVFHEPNLAPLLQLISVFIPFMVVNDQLGNALKGFKKFDAAVVAQYAYQPITRLILIALLAIIGLDAKTAVAVFGLSSITASIVMYFSLKRHFKLRRTVKVDQSTLNELVQFSFPVWISSLLRRFQGNIQTLFIGTLNTISGVGVFSVVNQITHVSGEFSSSINTTSKPVIAELHDRGDIKQMGRIYQLTNKWVVMVQLPIFLFMVIFPEAILSIFGEAFTLGAIVLIILAVADFVNVSTGMGGIIIDMTGYSKLKLFNSILRITLIIVLDYLLIPRWGLVGAAVAILITEGTLNILRMMQVYWLFHIWPYNLSFIKPLIATGAALISVYMMSIWLPSDKSLINIAVVTAVMFLVYAAVLLALGFSVEEARLFRSFYNNAKRVVNGKGSR